MLSVVSIALLAQYGPDPPGLPDEVKCGWRSLAYEYAARLRPDAADEVKAALNVGAPMKGCSWPMLAQPSISDVPLPRTISPHVINIDGERGDDLALGSSEAPLRSLHEGIARCREVDGACTLMLQSGTYHLASPLELDSRDSHLTITTSAGGRAWLSGGVPLGKLQWRQEGQTRVWSADVSASGLSEIASLRVDGSRRSPARWPNANPEKDFWPVGYQTSKEKFAPAGDWLGPAIKPSPNPAHEVNISSPNRNWDSEFRTYRGGINGTCALYDPPFSFWCQSPPFSLGCGGCFTWNIPSGLNAHVLANRTLYKARGAGAQLFAWRKAHWANWVFDVDYIDQSRGGVVQLARGGWQGARGGAGSDWFISNVFEELDDELEFYYDEEAMRLYALSGSADGHAPPAGDEWIAIPNANYTVMSVLGSRAEPVKDLHLHGLGFRDTAWTMMRPHGVPGGGDWALERYAALFAEGTENLTLSNLTFRRTDGNALMLSKYHRGASIHDCDFKWLGGSAIALWGWTDEITDGGLHGVDSTAGA